MLRFGFFTSPAVKVMLFQASEEKSEPTCATQKATSSPNAPAVAAIGAAMREVRLDRRDVVRASRGRVKLAAMAAALRPTRMPSTIRASSDSVLAEVKMFWISLPRRMPRVLSQVRKTISRMPTSCCVERLTA